MRHRKNSRKLSRQQSHRKAMLSNMARSLIIYQRIKTTLAKAKESRRLVERLITLGKKNTLHSRRLCYDILRDRELVRKLFLEIAPLFKDRNGGFTRIVRLKNRSGDGAGIVIFELVEKPKKEEKAKRIREEKPKEEKPPKEITKKEEKPKIEKPKTEEIPEKQEKPQEEKPKPSEEKPKKKHGFLDGIRKFFKK
ncbi:MAG: 50S ribosomal protein L17 [Candidatus Omnitrophica bacterium]|nr:50S ribosomal protein L17 [Candidatus Omnitrophota bacterium]